MNTIKMSKILALIVVVAMVMAVVPVAFAASEPVAANNFYGWNFKSGAIRTDIGVETAQAAIVSWNDDRVSFADFTLPEDVKAEGNQIIKATLSTMAYGNNGSSGNTVATVFAVDPDAVAAQDNDQLTTARANKVNVGTIAYTFSAAAWNEAPSTGVLAIPASAVKDGKVGILLSNRNEDGVEIYGIASLKDATLTVDAVVSPASVTVDIVDVSGTVLEDDIAGVDGLMSGDTFDGKGLSFNKYLIVGKNLYTVDLPDPITLAAGENEFNLEATLYKTIDSENLIPNPSFEEGMADWTVVGGTNLAEAEVADDGSAQFEIVKDIEGDETVEAQQRTTDGENALWLKGGTVNNSKSGTQVDTSWAVEPNSRYFVSFDFMSTQKDGGTQYMWLYATDSADEPEITYYADALDNSSHNLQQMNVHTRNIFETKQFIIETSAAQNKIGFGGAWFTNDAAPIVDNFQLYKLADLTGDITYDVVVTTDGTAKGTELGKLTAKEGTVGETVAITAGEIVSKKRVADKYYSNKADSIELEAGKTTYYVSADVVATITGTEPVEVTTVGDYEPMLPATVQTVVDNTDFAAEALPVKWEGNKGTVDDTGLTVTATVNALDKTYDLVDTVSYAGQDNYERVKAHALKLPMAVNGKFAVEFEVTLNKKADNWIFLNDATADYFNPSQICLGFNEGFVAVDGKGDGNRNSDDVSIMPFEEGKTYTVLVVVDAEANKYTATIKNEAGEVAVAADRGFRTNGTVNSLVAMTNNGTTDAWISNDNNIAVFNIQVYQEGVTAPTANEITTGLNYLTDGEDKDALTISVNVTGDLTDKKLVVTAIDANGKENRHKPDTVVYDGEATAAAAIIPSNANMEYEIAIVDAAGVVTGLERDVVLAPMVIDDIAANLSQYSQKDQMARVAQAVAALNQIGAVYELTEDGAKFNDGRDAFITADVVPTEDSKTVVNLTVNEGMFANGFGFKVGVKAGAAGAAAAAVLPEGAEGEVFRSISVADGTVTVQGTDGTVYTLSLESVQIEFVATDVVESDADSAGAEADFIPEL